MSSLSGNFFLLIKSWKIVLRSSSESSLLISMIGLNDFFQVSKVFRNNVYLPSIIFEFMNWYPVTFAASSPFFYTNTPIQKLEYDTCLWTGIRSDVEEESAVT